MSSSGGALRPADAAILGQRRSNIKKGGASQRATGKQQSRGSQSKSRSGERKLQSSQKVLKARNIIFANQPGPATEATTRIASPHLAEERLGSFAQVPTTGKTSIEGGKHTHFTSFGVPATTLASPAADAEQAMTIPQSLRDEGTLESSQIATLLPRTEELNAQERQPPRPLVVHHPTGATEPSHTTTSDEAASRRTRLKTPG